MFFYKNEKIGSHLVENFADCFIFPYIEVKGECRLFFDTSSQLFTVIFNYDIYLIKILIFHLRLFFN